MVLRTPPGAQERQKDLGYPSARDIRRRHHISAPDLRAALLGKEHVHTAGEAIVWAAALRPACAARAALLEKLLTRLKGKDVKIRG
jgi:hypothetical protein